MTYTATGARDRLVPIATSRIMRDSDTITVRTSLDGDALPPLGQLLDIGALQRLQNRFSAMTSLSICICDAQSEMITTPTYASVFLRLLNRTPAGRQMCESSIREAAQRDSAEQVSFTGQSGVSLYGTPIVFNGERLGTLVIGVRPPRKFTAEQVRAVAAGAGVDEVELQQAADLIPAWTEQDRKATFQFVDLLAETIATLYGQSLQIRKQLHDLQVVHEVTQLLAESHELQDILNRTAERVVAALRVKACGIRILDEGTGELVIKAVAGLSEEYLNKPPILLANNEIDQSAFHGRTVYIEDARTDPRIRFREKAAAEGIVSGLCVPLSHRGRTVGVLRVYTSERRYFGPDEIELLRSIAAQAAAAIISANLHEERIRTEHSQRQLKYASQIQRRMIPQRPPSHPRLDVGAVYSPTLEVGGDFYDFIEMADGRLGIGIADVVGKGVPAALLMASIRAALRTYSTGARTAAQAIGYVNEHMYRDTDPQEFATFFYGIFDADADRLSYCNAGHEPPVLLRGQDFLRLDAGGLVIGAFADAHYEGGELRVLPGDVLILTTDGTTEAMNFENEVFGRGRMRESILRHRALEAAPMAQQILWDIRRFVGLADQSDDIALVVVKVR